ncbi:probable JmjC domain-containing histone demethylation protein 2C [Pristis pectinata]|uniref:probable JmjC domain-containing histone demethylation protein 2C n=1 Tax=Pristis pectinata TaxID=685728 RepID=UPI00223E7C50|nr:probable JmjC domain-containing histone demethylation protein 2C [Pristis pectinata]
MAAGPRMELVGKRFVCVGDSGSELDVSRIHEWEWRAGVIRAVSYREPSNSELSAYVEFDDLEWEKREWVKVYEDFQIFLVEHQLVWAKRKNPSQSQGSKNKQIQWPALTFKSVVGKTVLHLLIAIEFFVDKQLNFIPGDSAFQVYQDDIDSLSPVLRDNPPLHEEVKAWVKEQKVQEIFMQGPYSLNGYRVRVYRQDSATQWFTGIITYHDLLSRTMIVMNDQVLEPQNVDPSMVQMTFLDDVVHSLLKGENIGITSRRRSRSNQNSSAVHGHYTRAQANSPRLVMSSQTSSGKQNQQQQRIIRSNKRKESDCSLLEEDKTEDKCENSVKEESSRSKTKQLVNKRRKPLEDEKQATSERLKTNNNSDTESSESESSVNKVILDSSTEQSSENELTNKIILDDNKDEKIFQNNTELGEKMVIANSSHCNKMQEVKKDNETQRPELVDIDLHKPEVDCQQSITSQKVTGGCTGVGLKTISESVEPSPDKLLNFSVQKPILGFSNGTLSKNVLHEAGDTCSLSVASQKLEINSISSTHSISKKHASGIQKSEVDAELSNRINKVKSQVNKFSVVTEYNNSLENEKASNPSGPQSNVSVHAINKISKPNKVITSLETLKPEVSYPRSPADSVSRSTSRYKNESSSFQPLPARTIVETTRSPLIVDKNEHFTVYRDPALVGPEPGTKSLSPYLQPHLHPLHTSSRSTCLMTNSSNLSARVSSHDSANSPQTSGSNDARAVSSVLSHSVHSSHLLPRVLPGVPSASLVCGHLDSVHARNLNPLTLTQCQQQCLQLQSSPLLGRTHPPAPYNQLGLYPVLWQYSNSMNLSSALSMASPKWIHPENSVSAEAFKRNASSPWLPQHTTVTSADDLGLLNHIPVRPASAEPHRPLKLVLRSSPPLSKPGVNHQKEKIDKKTLIDSFHSVTSTRMKLEFNHDRHSQGMENQLARGFMNTVLCQNKPKRSLQEQSDSQIKYKEESRKILQESIEVARLASTIKTNEIAKDSYSRVPPLPTESLKPQKIKQDSETKCYAIQLYASKNSVPHSVPQSNYFTTLSNSIINEPPRLYLSKDAYPYAEKTNPSTPALLSYNKTLSKPPPLIKHQPKSEGSVGKATEQFAHQVTSQSHDSNTSDHKGVTEQLPILPSVVTRGMPSLHRAPVYQHPSHHVTERKEGNYRNLSPPTLTPVLPVNAAKLSELQKPPTLLPEPRPEVKTCVNNHTVTSNISWNTSAGFLHKPASHLDNKNSEVLQVSPASVIVRPSSTVKQESKAKDSGKERLLMQSDSFDSKVKEVCKIILPNLKLDTTSAEHERNFKVFLPGNNLDSNAVTNSLYNSSANPSTSRATTTNILGDKETSITSCQSCTPVNNSISERIIPKTSDHLRMQIEECTIYTTSAAVSSADAGRTGTTVQSNTGIPNTTDYYQLKKHKAALAIAHSGSTFPDNNESASFKSDKSSAAVPPKNTGTISAFCKVNSVTNGQISQSNQPSFHTKLKKAWLTRHSEEDKNTCNMENKETITNDAKKPITISSPASTTDDVDKKAHSGEVKTEQEERKTRGTKRTYESGSESDVSDESENKLEHRVKRQPKPTYKKRQNDLQKRKAEIEREEVEIKPNGALYRNAKEKKSKLQSNGLPRSVLKDWRKVKKLKQTGEPFLQDGSCSEIAPNLQKCRECRMIRYRKNEEFSHSAVFCRFYYFRRLAFSKNAVLRTDGFSTPDQYDEEAINLWLPKYSADLNLDMESSKYILRNIGDKFCQIETSEKTAMTWLKPDAKLAWKRAVKGVQEMCDACEATLFNIHWVCQKCGFVVCLDCYEAKERRGSKAVKEVFVWLKCVKGQVHDPKSLMPTQIIPGSVLADIGEVVHSINDGWKIATRYPRREQNVQPSKLSTTNGVLQCVLNRNAINSVAKQHSTVENSETNGGSNSPRRNIIADKNKELHVSKAVKMELNQMDKTENCKTATTCVNNEQGSTLRDLLTTTAGKLRLGSTDAGIAFAPVFSAETPTGRSTRSMPNLLDDIIASVVENKIPAIKSEKSHGKEETNQNLQKEIKNLNLDSRSKNNSEVPYSWLCEGNVLWLHDPGHPSNCKIFRECWRQEQPVVVSGVHKKLNSNIWKPESFNEEFADQKADLVNCKDGSIISSVRIQDFWDGFEDITKRLKSKNGESLLLKLNDWPSGEDFQTMMPSRYDDFMKNLPLPQYCNPEGNLNLASRLPNFFVQPDLGPKLYGVYGQTTVKEHGTTNLHLDVADVVNVLVYVGVPKGNGNNHRAAILKKTEEEIDESTKNRLKNSDETPGALWHIFSAKDTNKIKEFLQKVNEELGQESSEHDPLHDQICYLDKKLRQRLYEECGIQCRSILQFLGDTFLIPAGTLRQMQSIYSCIQISEDFVSPEHVAQSFHLTHELRHQSKDEINYEDKLQIKNIIYHSVKDAVGALRLHEEKTHQKV